MPPVLNRIVRLIVRPRAEWAAIAAEPASVDRLVARYIVPLSLIPAVATWIGMSVFDIEWDPDHGYLVPRDQIFTAAATTLFATILSIFALAGIFALLAPTFGARRDYAKALTVATYGAVPVLVASATLVLPIMAIVTMVALCHTLFLFWLGARAVLEVTAAEQAEFIGISLLLLGVLSTLAGAAASSLGWF